MMADWFGGRAYADARNRKRALDLQEQQIEAQNALRGLQAQAAQQQIDNALRTQEHRRDADRILGYEQAGPWQRGYNQGPTFGEKVMQVGMIPGQEGRAKSLAELHGALNPKPDTKTQIVDGQLVTVRDGVASASQIPGLTPEEEKPKSPLDFFDQEEKLNKRFVSESGEFIKQRDAWNRIQDSGQDPSAAGDLALIFNYMKLLDPGSVVREGEFATAQNTGAVDSRIFNIYNKVLTGQRLAPEQRQDFLDRSRRLYAGAENQHGKRVERFSRRAKAYGLEPERVIGDLLPFERNAKDPLGLGL